MFGLLASEAEKVMAMRNLKEFGDETNLTALILWGGTEGRLAASAFCDRVDLVPGVTASVASLS